MKILYKFLLIFLLPTAALSEGFDRPSFLSSVLDKNVDGMIEFGPSLDFQSSVLEQAYTTLLSQFVGEFGEAGKVYRNCTGGEICSTIFAIRQSNYETLYIHAVFTEFNGIELIISI